MEEVLLHVFSPSITKHLCCTRCICNSPCSSHHLSGCTSRVAPIIPETLQTSRHHLLKAHHKDTIRTTMTYNISRQMKTRRASRAIIVDVVNGDLCHAELIEYSLAAGGIAVAVASYTLVYVVVVDLRVKHGLDARLKTEFGVINFSARFDELGHAYAEDIAWLVAFDDHGGGVCEQGRWNNLVKLQDAEVIM